MEVSIVICWTTADDQLLFLTKYIVDSRDNEVVSLIIMRWGCFRYPRGGVSNEMVVDLKRRWTYSFILLISTLNLQFQHPMPRPVVHRSSKKVCDIISNQGSVECKIDIWV